MVQKELLFLIQNNFCWRPPATAGGLLEALGGTLGGQIEIRTSNLKSTNKTLPINKTSKSLVLNEHKNILMAGSFHLNCKLGKYM